MQHALQAVTAEREGGVVEGGEGGLGLQEEALLNFVPFTDQKSTPYPPTPPTTAS